jgi:hypothetical protein
MRMPHSTATLLIGLLPAASAAAAQPEEPSAAVRRLAEEFSDPLTTLPQLFLQDIYTSSSYGTEAPTNRVILRAIISRVPESSLFPFVQLIRPSFSSTVRFGVTVAFPDWEPW